jgi:tetratricopeptide (TPR) repeat protein
MKTTSKNDGKNDSCCPDLYERVAQLAGKGQFHECLALTESGINSIEEKCGADSCSDYVSCEGVELLPIEEISIRTPVYPSEYWELVQVKAEIYGRLGRFEESLREFERLLSMLDDTKTVARSVSNDNLATATRRPRLTNRANVLYACGRLCTAMKKYDDAIRYHTQELHCAQQVVMYLEQPSKECEKKNSKYIAKNDPRPYLAVSKIYHTMALVAQKGILDLPLALRYYEDALQVESQLWKKIASFIPSASKAIGKRDDVIMSDVTRHITHTKRCIGRIYFELGDIDKALSVSMR